MWTKYPNLLHVIPVLSRIKINSVLVISVLVNLRQVYDTQLGKCPGSCVTVAVIIIDYVRYGQLHVHKQSYRPRKLILNIRTNIFIILSITFNTLNFFIIATRCVRWYHARMFCVQDAMQCWLTLEVEPSAKRFTKIAESWSSADATD